MTEKKVQRMDDADLRHLAEERLRENRESAHPIGRGEEPLKPLSKLQVHQIEQELQNEELLQARAEGKTTEVTLGKYTDLFDSAPVGYFNLDHGGIIRAVNLTGAGYLGVERSLLINQRLDLFISDETRPFFHKFLDNVFASETKETCEVVFLKERRLPLVVQVEAVISNSRVECYAVVIDITERKRAEDEIRRDKGLLRCIIDSLGDLIFIKDMNGVYQACNKAGEDFVGLPECEQIGKTDFDFFGREVAEVIRECDRQILASGRERRFEEWVTYRDGRMGLLDTVKAPFYGPDGKLLGLVGIARDITERKRMEDALRESEQRVRRKLERILDPEGDIGDLELADIIDANEIQALMDDLYRLAGLKMSIIDLKGRVLVDVGWQDICSKFHRAHPETRKKCLESDTDLTVGIPPGEFRTYKCKNNMWHLVTPIIVGGRHMGNLFMGQFFFDNEQIDYDLFRTQTRRYGFSEGEYIAALEAVPRLSKDYVNMGKAVFLWLTDMFSKLSYANIKLARSLTERDQLTATLRESRALLHSVIEGTSDAVYVKDREGRYLLFNSAAARFTGKHAEDVIGQDDNFLYPPGEALELMGKDRRVMEGRETQTYEEVVTGAAGERAFFLSTKGPLFDGEGNVTGLFGIGRDITERKRAEDALRIAHGELESHVRERTRQLTSLTAELSLAEERERRRIATELHDQVGQTLIFSKIKLNSLSQALSTESFGKLVSEISEYINQSIEEIRSLTFQLSPPLLYEVGFDAAVEWLGEEFQEKYGFQVEFQDDGREKPLDEEASVALYQMVRELLINVAKHAKAKKVRVSVRKISDKIKIIVADDGLGFFCLNSMRRKNEKSGFGLFNIRHRIEFMGGGFKIKSKINQGTCATLILPVKADENSAKKK
jgi:PAS domain S-box-containing protein